MLTKLRTRASNGSATLMKVIKNPVEDHLPMGVKKIGTSTKGKLVHLGEYTKDLA